MSTIGVDTAAVGVNGADAAARRLIVLQVAAVLALAVVPDLWNALLAWWWDWGFGGVVGWWGDSVQLLLRSLRVLLPLLVIAAMSGEGRAAFGLSNQRVGQALWMGVLLMAVVWALSVPAGFVLGLVLPFEDAELVGPSSGAEWLLLIPALAANSAAEEFAIWGFLYTRLRKLSAGEVWPLLLAGATFASYHVYLGVGEAVVIFLCSLLHGLVFRMTGVLWPLIVAHTLWNIVITLMM